MKPCEWRFTVRRVLLMRCNDLCNVTNVCVINVQLFFVESQEFIRTFSLVPFFLNKVLYLSTIPLWMHCLKIFYCLLRKIYSKNLTETTTDDCNNISRSLSDKFSLWLLYTGCPQKTIPCLISCNVKPIKAISLK
jgi:hypothetical protein